MWFFNRNRDKIDLATGSKNIWNRFVVPMATMYRGMDPPIFSYRCLCFLAAVLVWQNAETLV